MCGFIQEKCAVLTHEKCAELSYKKKIYAVFDRNGK